MTGPVPPVGGGGYFDQTEKADQVSGPKQPTDGDRAALIQSISGTLGSLGLTMGTANAGSPGYTPTSEKSAAAMASFMTSLLGELNHALTQYPDKNDPLNQFATKMINFLNTPLKDLPFDPPPKGSFGDTSLGMAIEEKSFYDDYGYKDGHQGTLQFLVKDLNDFAGEAGKLH